ncbi:unnamed protein product (macronuclear) [Paramecium tetraurelia]|uniref:Protein kinase domain-containing protein n=1 Tax=Paramecium tetraurelia TaxID=5888 RepID=A0BH10_PARTE|nr:uncharacterized protein GSPATT00028862001 [Paramecium tetraurelia]CAK57827.1 unnamed protein product [Paramecium tetraurelia]|eukprot:XP_001425225.1 hypothetical protein (macronuclear) [Paramecium tetraurelia strain d4-2]
MLQSNSLKDRLKCKIEFDQEEEKPEIPSLSLVDDVIKFEDRYDILQVLGEGAHAIVKLARRKETNELYAVKITRMNNEEIYNNVKRTFYNARCLRHQNIIQEIELFINEKYCRACLVMEYCPFPTLQQILIERGTLREDETRQIIKQLLITIQYIHNKGISHRDIKPDNILVNLEGDCELKLLDFGVSRRFLSKNNHIEMLTKTGHIYYSAPEIYHQPHYSKEIDIWSIGVVMFQCMTGQLPLHENTMSDQIQLLKTPELWNFKNKVKDESLSAQNLLFRLLSADPKKRITPIDALTHPFIEKNHIYTTLAMLSSTKLFEDDDGFANKCKSLQTSLSINQKQNLHRALKTLHLGIEYQDIVIEDLIQELGNIHVVQKRNGEHYSGLIQLINSLSNSSGNNQTEVQNSSGQCNLEIGSSQSILSTENYTQDCFGDLCNMQSSVDLGITGNTGNNIQNEEKKKQSSINQFANEIGSKIECSIDINLVEQEFGSNNKQNQFISNLDVLGIKECKEEVENTI